MDIGIRKKLLWAVFLSVAFMVLLLYVVDWTHFPSILNRVRINYLLVAFGVLLLANIIRSYRFYTLDHLEKKKLIPWIIINKLYNFLTATLPGGVGEAATAYMIKRYSFFNMLSAFRILLLSRVMDLIGILALLLFVATQISTDIHYKETVIWLSGALLFLSIATMVPATEHFILKLMQKLPGHNKVMKRMREKLGELLIISEEHRGRKTFSITLIQSALVITITAVSLHFISLSFESGFTLMQSFYCYAIYAILQLIPIQGIAGIGTQPARWVIALNMAGYNGDDAVALSIFFHITFYMFITIMGFAALSIWLFRRKTV